MKLLFISCLLFSTLAARAESCNEDCSETCKVTVMGISEVEPICFSGCRAWHLANCWDISQPHVSASGELGHSAYPAAASTMRVKNPIDTNLDEHEKKVLRPFFGNIVDKVRLHLKASMMGQIGPEPLGIEIGASSGQTYGYDVYIPYYRTELERVDLVTLIGHELCHTRQYVQRGESLQKFGRDYFEGFARDGGYRANQMEEECYAMEDKIRQAAEGYFAWYDQHKRPWNFDACNRTGYETIYVALAWPHKIDGLSLVPAPLVKGWYPLKKGECKRLLTGAKSDEYLDVYANAGEAGNWAWWGGGEGNNYCIDPVNKFETGYRTFCAKRKLVTAPFKEVPNPWRKGGNETYTVSFTGDPTLATICNKSGKRVWGVLSKVEWGQWMVRGWWEFTDGQCRTWNLGNYQGSVYVYGETDGATTTWVDPAQPALCIFRGQKFTVQHNGTCPKGGTLMHPFEFKVKTGEQTWDFRP